jgi:hypothetical protein
MANIKKPLFVTVATAHWREAICISRYLDVHGVPSAVEHAEPRTLDVRVRSKNEARARKLLSTRRKGDCGPISYT